MFTIVERRLHVNGDQFSKTFVDTWFDITFVCAENDDVVDILMCSIGTEYLSKLEWWRWNCDLWRGNYEIVVFGMIDRNIHEKTSTGNMEFLGYFDVSKCRRGWGKNSNEFNWPLSRFSIEIGIIDHNTSIFIQCYFSHFHTFLPGTNFILVDENFILSEILLSFTRLTYSYLCGTRYFFANQLLPAKSIRISREIPSLSWPTCWKTTHDDDFGCWWNKRCWSGFQKWLNRSKRFLKYGYQHPLISSRE